jgi:hypothetical protein
MNQLRTVILTWIFIIAMIICVGCTNNNFEIHKSISDTNNHSEFKDLSSESLTSSQEVHMLNNMISAEVEPSPGQEKQAAMQLQRMGFNVLHVGSTISIQGSKNLWESTFKIEFEPQQKKVMQELEGTQTYYRPKTDTLLIPSELESSILNVYFVEPPELF